MIIASSPLRISLLGGSTDLEDFIEWNDVGEVISFPVNLYTYTAINLRYDNKFLIQYSRSEDLLHTSQIKNDVVRVVLEYFKITRPSTITLTADIPSEGSGLAASSSFIISMIKAVSAYQGVRLSDLQICKLALKLEREFNPLTGRQDPFGCGINGFKSLEFNSVNDPRVIHYNEDYFKRYDFYLIPVGSGRKSTDVLKSLKLEERLNIYKCVSEGKKLLAEKNYESFNKLITKSWEAKKHTSPHIVNSSVRDCEEFLKGLGPGILAYKLCGAGNGGYMFAVTPKNATILDKGIKVNIDKRRVSIWEIA